MKMELVSWNGHAFSPNYNAFILYPRQLRVNATANFLEVAGSFSEYVGKTFGGGSMTIQIKYLATLPADVHMREAELTRWFSTLKETPYKLLAQDTADSNRQWYVMATPVSVMQEDDSAIILLALEEPYWSVETLSTSTWSITASGQTKSITNLGELAKPVLKIKPTFARSGGYLYRRFVQETPQFNAQNHPVCIGPFDTAALVTAGKCQADGDDFRVMVDGVEVPRWFGTGAAAFNQTTTKTWITLDLKAGIQVSGTNVLGADLSSAGAGTELQFAKNDTMRTALESLAVNGSKTLRFIHWESGVQVIEYFSFTAVDLVNYKVTGVTRAAKDSSKYNWGPSYGTDALGANPGYVSVISFEHDILLVYGNSAAVAPVYDESHKPIIDMTNSTNLKFYYTEFYEEGNPLRAGSWVKSQFYSDLGTSTPYTATHETDISPATEIGLKMATGQVSGVETAENARQAWTLHLGCGFDIIESAAGEKYRASTTWPTTEIQKSDDGYTYVSPTTGTTISTPTSSGVWQTWSMTGKSLLSAGGTYPYFLRLLQSGSLPALANNKASVEMNACTLDLFKLLVMVVRSEVISTYNMDATITNVTTGETLLINHLFTLDEELTIDCENRTAVYQDGTNALTSMVLGSERVDWLNLEYGVNQLKYEEAGAAGVTIVIDWRDKAAL